jgi:hypothetical protein
LGVIAIPLRPAPLRGIDALIVLFARLTTDTVFCIMLDTYPYGCAETARAVAMNAKTRKKDIVIELRARIVFFSVNL